MRNARVYPNIFMIEKKMTIVIEKLICRYTKKSAKVKKGLYYFYQMSHPL